MKTFIYTKASRVLFDLLQVFLPFLIINQGVPDIVEFTKVILLLTISLLGVEIFFSRLEKLANIEIGFFRKLFNFLALLFLALLTVIPVYVLQLNLNSFIFYTLCTALFLKSAVIKLEDSKSVSLVSVVKFAYLFSLIFMGVYLLSLPIIPHPLFALLFSACFAAAACAMQTARLLDQSHNDTIAARIPGLMLFFAVSMVALMIIAPVLSPYYLTSLLLLPKIVGIIPTKGVEMNLAQIYKQSTLCYLLLIAIFIVVRLFI